MRKHILLTILLALLCIGAGRMWDYGETDLYGEDSLKFCGQVESGSSVTCTALTAGTTQDASDSVGYGDDDYYRGWRFLDAGSSHDICRMVVNMSLEAGTITGFTYYAQIWTLDGGGTALGDMVANGESAGVTGSQAWSDTPVTYNWSPSVTLAQNTTYIIVFTRKGWDNSNYASILKDEAADTMTYCTGIARWNSSEVRTNDYPTDDPKGTLYSDQ
jgi:hypothetical protein